MQKFIDSTFKIPIHQKIGGALLDINYKNCIDARREMLMADAPTFGLSWQSDGATISRMPFFNTLAMWSKIPPTCAAIHHCSDHIGTGDKKMLLFLKHSWLKVLSSIIHIKCTVMSSFLIVPVMLQRLVECFEQRFQELMHCMEEIIKYLFFHDLSKQLAVRVSLFSLLSFLRRRGVTATRRSLVVWRNNIKYLEEQICQVASWLLHCWVCIIGCIRSQTACFIKPACWAQGCHCESGPPSTHCYMSQQWSKVVGKDIEAIVDLFWDDFNYFEQKKNHLIILQGEIHLMHFRVAYLWHEKYSLPYTSVIGFVACRWPKPNGRNILVVDKK